ncbi:MAG: ABC transporter permease [Candidatus Rokuibacteriota bacterium]
MLGYVVQRVVYIVFILALISVLVFAITQILPGNVATMILDQYATPESLRALEAKLGLDDPYHVQYWRWASALLRGDLSKSLIMDQPIGPILWPALQRSAVLALLSIVAVTVLGLGLGVLAAVRQNRPLDHAVSAFTFLGISVPEFFWGIVLMLVFAGYLRWLPAAGYAPLSEGVWPWLSHLLIPVATLTFTLLAHVSRLTRSSVLEVLQSPYIRAARAKGLPERVVLVRHALRNGLLPTITVLAIDVGWLIGGIVVVETIFAFPGVGRLLMFAIQRRDLPLLQVTILIVTSVYCLANLAADLLYAYVNPRIRYGRAAAA